MRTRLAYLGAWLLGTVVAIAVTTAAVGLVRDEVSDGPTVSTIALPDASTSTSPTTPSTTDASDTTEPPTTSTIPVPPSSSSTSSTTTEPPTTSTTTPSTSTTSTTMPSTTTTTVASSTTTTGAAFVRTYTLVGGAVTIRASAPSVTLVGATPSGGFTVDVDNAGPEEVVVEFESADHESEFRAKWDDGELVVEIDESDD